jgi:hypothetical protein
LSSKALRRLPSRQSVASFESELSMSRDTTKQRLAISAEISKLQRLAAALNHRALLLHESLLPNREVETVGQGMKKSEATYPFGVSLCSVKRVTLGDGPFHRQPRARTTAEPSR